MPTTPLKCAIDVDTRSAPPGEQLDLFRSWHSAIAEIDLLREQHDSFQARERAWQLGNLVLASIECPGVDYRLRWRHKKKPLLDHWFLSLMLSGKDNCDGMAIGQMRLRCLSAPGECDSEGDLILALFMPYDVVASRSDNAELNEAAKQFLAEYLVILHRSLSSLRRKDVQHIVAATTSLVAACLLPSADRVAEAEGPIRTVMMRRATEIISRRLGDPTLTPNQLCRELGVSRSRLYRLFEPVGGVTHYIRRQRLQKTQEILADSSDQRTISGIASEWGFPDASAYSRMFRREFGVSPGDAREEGWQGVTHAPVLPANLPTRPASTTLSNLLLSTY